MAHFGPVLIKLLDGDSLVGVKAPWVAAAQAIIKACVYRKWHPHGSRQWQCAHWEAKMNQDELDLLHDAYVEAGYEVAADGFSVEVANDDSDAGVAGRGPEGSARTAGGQGPGQDSGSSL